MGQGSSHLKCKVSGSNSSISRVSDFIIATKKYNKVQTQQASFEENIVDFMAKAYTPLSLVDCREFSKLIYIVVYAHFSCFDITSLKKFYYP